MAREGLGETRPRTDRATEDRIDRCCADDDAGSGSRKGPRARPQEGCLTRPRDPLPTRVADLPRLPAGYEAALDAGLRRLGLEPAREARAAIDDHVRLLLAWTGSINLTAIREPEAVARLHVLDSLAGAAVLADRPAGRFVDIGSGGGFPGVPLALVLPGWQVVLLDSVAKKSAFLATVVTATGLAARARVITARAEELAARADHRESYAAATARAVAGLPELVELAFPLLEVGGHLVAWKRAGAALDDELSRAARALAALGGSSAAVLPVEVDGLEDHRLVVARKGRPTPPAFPRSPAERRRRAW